MMLTRRSVIRALGVGGGMGLSTGLFYGYLERIADEREDRRDTLRKDFPGASEETIKRVVDRFGNETIVTVGLCTGAAVATTLALKIGIK